MPDPNNFIFAEFLDAVPDADPDVLRGLLSRMPAADAAEAFEELDDDDQRRLINRLETRDFEPLLPHLSTHVIEHILDHVPEEEQRAALDAMPDDTLTDFLQDVPEENSERYLALLDPETLARTQELLKYPDTSAGGRMTTAFATVHEDMTIREAITSLKGQEEEKEILSRIYVVDDLGRLVGKLRLRDLAFSESRSQHVTEVMQHDLLAVDAWADQEMAANMVLRYDMLALPVINEQNQIIGLITHDDAMEILMEETTEDIEKQSGISGMQSEHDYLDTSVFVHFRRRFLWILPLALLAIISGYVIYSFEEVLSSVFLLAIYMPMVVAAGGNTGAQAATTVIRAMSLGEFEPSEFIRAVWKELRIGLCIGLLLAACIAIQIVFFMPVKEGSLPQGHTLMDIALTVAISLTAQVTTSTVLGAALPILARALKLDPALVASPAITTVVDVTGLVIYFSLARAILGL